MRALGKTILKDSHAEQWQVRVQDEKFKQRQIKKYKKTSVEDLQQFEDDDTLTLDSSLSQKSYDKIHKGLADKALKKQQATANRPEESAGPSQPKTTQNGSLDGVER
ncbi:hypothetical protein RCL_jg6320.t1 [Rhizophagus clarus]|uniref:Uncharacterized protein n=1 Tax=Rhizophagus clarus TaxID=94130 RepID=A0A8H3L3H8_9GLOM|nr:hypothetical protein RCL_jg6320.t1 [Rhizophagus clarus]